MVKRTHLNFLNRKRCNEEGFLKCVFEQNLGDDLLINILCSKYISSQFYIISDKDIDSFPNNLKIIKVPSLLYRLFRKTAFKLKK